MSKKSSKRTTRKPKSKIAVVKPIKPNQPQQTRAEKKLQATIEKYKQGHETIDAHMVIMVKQLEQAERDLAEQSSQVNLLRDALSRATTNTVQAQSRIQELVKLMLAIIESDL